MKTLVVYYSRTENTKKIAEEISKNLNADIDRIIDTKKRKGIIGFLIAAKDSLKEKLTEINYKKNTKDYDLVVIGSPVWAGTISSPIRSYLKKNELKNVAFFCTHRGRKEKIFEEMEKLSDKPIAVLDLNAKKINSSKEEIKNFCEKLK